ncbi:hypothetical protein Tco_1195284 [Tanacetum coccineum]
MRRCQRMILIKPSQSPRAKLLIPKIKSTTKPLLEGTNTRPKDSGRLKPLADKDSSTSPVTVLSRTDDNWREEMDETSKSLKLKKLKLIIPLKHQLKNLIHKKINLLHLPKNNLNPQKLRRLMHQTLEVLYAQVAEDHWDKHEEAAASYVDFKAAVDGNFSLPSSGCAASRVPTVLFLHCLKSMQLLRGEFIETDGGLVKPPSYTKGEQLSSEETIKEAQTEHVEKEPKVEDVYYELEKRNQIAAEEAKLLEITKPELIKVIQEEATKAGVDPKILDVHREEHSEKIRKARELRKKNIDQYRGNDRGNFDVFNPFKFGYFGVTELDELGLIIQKKKNNVVGDLITSLGKRKKKIQELESKTRIPGLVCNRRLLEGIPFVNNLVIEQPENEMFFIDVFGDEAFQRMSGIHKVDVETLLTYLIEVKESKAGGCGVLSGLRSNARNINKFQPLHPTVVEVPNNFEDPVLPPTTSTSRNIRKSQPISKKIVFKKSNLGKEASASLNNITAEKHDALMGMEALKETLRVEMEEKAMVEEILRKQVEDEKAWEDYENAFKGLDDGLEDAVRIRPFVNDDISEFKDFVEQGGKKAVSEEAPPFRIFVKNKGRSERIAKLQGKNFKFDEFRTGSSPKKAFDVECIFDKETMDVCALTVLATIL